MSEFNVEYVPCCVCHETGKVARFVFWKRECPVCLGKGQRPILMAKNFSPADRAMVRQSAIYGSPNFTLPPLSLESILGFRF